MQKILKNYFTLLLLILSFLFITSCEESKALNKKGIEHELEFGGVYVDITIEDFNQLGFKYGDSLNVSFSNGYKLKDIPYYNGYYTKAGEPLVVAYPGYKALKVCINNGDDLFLVANLNENDTVSIVLNKAEKYLDIQEARDLSYYDDRFRYDSDEMFANFREIKVTGLKEKTLYRSASPCDNQHNRAGYVDNLIKDNHISCIFNLSDNNDKIKGYIAKEDFNSPYFLSLYNENRVIPIALNMNYNSMEFKNKIANGLKELIKHDGPYLIHCTEGKDRTGFICMLLEALVGASYEEIKNDYMITYYNYYRINLESDAKRYNTIVDNLLIPMYESVVKGEENSQTMSIEACTTNYLLEAGMSEEEVNLLKTKLRG